MLKQRDHLGRIFGSRHDRDHLAVQDVDLVEEGRQQTTANARIARLPALDPYRARGGGATAV